MANDKVKLIEKQIEKLESQLQAAKAREETQLKENRKRMEMLIGAYYLAKHEREGTLPELTSELEKSNAITRKKDRILFGLPEIAPETIKENVP